MRILSRIFLVLFLCFTFSSCGTATASAEKGIDFTLKSITGQEITLSSLKGKKVLLDFFATWCPPCKKELKMIDEVVTKYKNDNFEILCISVDNEEETVKNFIAKNGYKMNVLFDDKNVAGSYGVNSIPSLFLVDEKGDIVWNHVGLLSMDELKDVLGIKK